MSTAAHAQITRPAICTGPSPPPPRQVLTVREHCLRCATATVVRERRRQLGAAFEPHSARMTLGAGSQAQCIESDEAFGVFLIVSASIVTRKAPATRCFVSAARIRTGAGAGAAFEPRSARMTLGVGSQAQCIESNEAFGVLLIVSASVVTRKAPATRCFVSAARIRMGAGAGAAFEPRSARMPFGAGSQTQGVESDEALGVFLIVSASVVLESRQIFVEQ